VAAGNGVSTANPVSKQAFVRRKKKRAAAGGILSAVSNHNGRTNATAKKAIQSTSDQRRLIMFKAWLSLVRDAR